MTDQQIFIEIGQRLNGHKNVTEAQRQFLRHFGAALEDGLSFEGALVASAPEQVKPGKQSIAYRVAKLNRDKRLLQAFDLLTGSDWGRCSQMASDLNRARLAMARNEALANDEYTQLLVRSLKTGIKPVMTTRGLYNLLVNN